ncbi:MAG: V4R domain-containing protein [Thermoplasmata archaeon]
MRFVKISQPEIEAVRQLYESVMSHACHGLFFREGLSLGGDIAEMAAKGEDFFDACRRILIARGWAEDITFGEKEVKVSGSIEATPDAGGATCHRLKGILSRVLETDGSARVTLTETKCASNGDSGCVFKIEG